MAGVRLQWAKFGKVDSFNIYRSEQPIDFSNLPPAIATGVIECDYWDTSAVPRTQYYYTIEALLGGKSSMSDEQVSVFTVNNDFVFVANDGYIPPTSPNINFIW